MSNEAQNEAQYEKYEVGWYYTGHPTPEEKRDALRLMLRRFGADPMLWHTAPEIREQHIEAARLSDFGKGPLVVPDQCKWAVYGELVSMPEKGYVDPRTNLPHAAVAADWFRESPPLEAYAAGTAHSS